tara:strand:+ start:271 stop:576 length:306 start_codon:yes stop_codon:yes gene_type:complete
MRAEIVLADNDSWKCDRCTCQITNYPYEDYPLAYSTSRRPNAGFLCIRCALRSSLTGGINGGRGKKCTTEKEVKQFIKQNKRELNELLETRRKKSQVCTSI